MGLRASSQPSNVLHRNHHRDTLYRFSVTKCIWHQNLPSFDPTVNKSSESLIVRTWLLFLSLDSASILHVRQWVVEGLGDEVLGIRVQWLSMFKHDSVFGLERRS